MLRTELTDTRVRPVENLATNPSFERTVSGTTVIRRNVVTNPRLAVNDSGWGSYATGGTASFSRVVGSFIIADAFGRSTVLSGTVANLYTMAGSTANATPVTGGRTYTASIYGRPSWNTYTRISLE